MRSTKWLTIGVVAGLGGVLAGCGVSPAAASPVLHPSPGGPHARGATNPPPITRKTPPPSTYTPRSTSIPVNTPTFPRIITMAMHHIAGLVKISAEAPTMVPWPANKSTTLFYSPQLQGVASGIPGLIASYRVKLSSPPEQVAAFGSAIFSSTAAATRDVQSLLPAAHYSYPPLGSQMALGDGVQALIGEDNGQNILAWTQGDWSVVVGAPRHLPSQLAGDVVQYLNTHFMPEPEPSGAGVGLIVVQVSPTGVATTVGWQEGRWVYTTTSYPTTAQPLVTALALALSMRRYPG